MTGCVVVLAYAGTVVLWTTPLSAIIILRNFGLTVFLAQVGTTSGPKFVETVRQTGLLFLGLGGAIVLVAPRSSRRATAPTSPARRPARRGRS